MQLYKPILIKVDSTVYVLPVSLKHSQLSMSEELKIFSQSDIFRKSKPPSESKSEQEEREEFWMAQGQ